MTIAGANVEFLVFNPVKGAGVEVWNFSPSVSDIISPSGTISCKNRYTWLDMTLFEALKFNRKPLEMLISLGGKQDDLRYIDLYSEYETMKGQGEKTTYTVAFLAQKYSVSERKVYDIIKRFGKHCTLCAVWFEYLTYLMLSDEATFAQTKNEIAYE